MDKFGWKLSDVTVLNDDGSEMPPTPAMQVEIDRQAEILPPMDIPDDGKTDDPAEL